MFGEDQDVVGLVCEFFEGKRDGKIEVSNPATVRRLKAAGLGAGLSFLYATRTIKAAGLSPKAAGPLWVVRPF